MLRDERLFPCTGALFSRLRLRLDVVERQPSRQLRNVSICIVSQFVGRIRIISRPDNGRNSAYIGFRMLFSERAILITFP